MYFRTIFSLAYLIVKWIVYKIDTLFEKLNITPFIMEVTYIYE